MENAHTISALWAKIAHIQGEIDLHYKVIKGLETRADTLKHKQTLANVLRHRTNTLKTQASISRHKADTLKQSLLIFDENFDLRSIKAIKHRNALFKPRELKGLVIDILKQKQSVNLNEIVEFIASQKSLDIKVVKPKVQRVVNALLKKGSIVVLNENNALKSDYSEPILSLNLGLFNEVLVG